MRTNPDTLARTLRGLDHAANTCPMQEARTVLRVHHTFGTMLLALAEDPALLAQATEDWHQVCRALLREAAELGLVDMAPYYAAERSRG